MSRFGGLRYEPRRVRCPRLTSKGRPCGGKVILDSDLCAFHERRRLKVSIKDADLDYQQNRRLFEIAWAAYTHKLISSYQ